MDSWCSPTKTNMQPIIINLLNDCKTIKLTMCIGVNQKSLKANKGKSVSKGILIRVMK